MFGLVFQVQWNYIFTKTNLRLVQIQSINPFPYNKILDHTKLKAFADDKLKVTKMIISVFDREENIVGKGEIACYEQFLLFPQGFQKGSFPDPSKGVTVWEWVQMA